MKRKEKEYIVIVSDLVCKYVKVKAKTQKTAIRKGHWGEWGDDDVEKEDVVERQCIEVADE